MKKPTHRFSRSPRKRNAYGTNLKANSPASSGDLPAPPNSEWRTARFDAFATLQRGFDLPNLSRNRGVIPVIGSVGIVGHHDTARVHGPGVVTGRSGSIGGATYIGSDFWPLNTALYVSDFHGNSPRFVQYFFQWFDLARFKSGVSVPTLNRNSVNGSDVIVPPASEQEKIAAALWMLERAVATQDRLIAATRELRQAAMQRLFTHGLRGESLKDTAIGSMPESWQPTPLSDLREFVQYGTSSKCGYERRGRPVIRIPNIIDGRVDTKDMKWADLSGKEINSHELASGDLLFIRTNGVIDRIGSCAVFRGEPAGALFASYLIRARPNESLHPEFFQYYSMTPQGRAQLAGRASAAADGKFNINTQLINSVLVPLPAPNEQRDIAAALATIDCKLAHHQRKRAALNDLFQTALHKLMTRQIRIADLDIDTSEVTTPAVQGEPE